MSRPFGNHRHRRRHEGEHSHVLPSPWTDPQEWRQVVDAKLSEEKGPDWVEANQGLLAAQWKWIEQTWL